MVDYREFRLSRIREPRFRHVPLLLFWPAYGLAFFSLEWLLPGRTYIPMHHPLDDRIPFCEFFVIFYVFWYAYMTLAVVYTFFTSPAAFRRLTWFYIITFGGGLLIFLVFPTCQNLRPEVFPRDNLLTRVMGFLYTIDTNTNVCPSLHVCGSIGAALGLTDTRRFSSPGWKAANFLMAGLISISTVFVKQHSVIDTLAALVYSGLAWWFVYRIPKKN